MPGEWWTRTWNPVTGCSPVSEGCRNCWAARMAKRLAGRCGYPPGDGFAPTFHADRLDEPLRWRKPEVVFVCGMGDLFHDDMRAERIDAVLAVMALSARHTFMVLTKRPKRMAEHIEQRDAAGWRDHLAQVAWQYWGDNSECAAANAIEGCLADGYNVGWPMRNLWLGVSVEDQATADERIPWLLRTLAAHRFVSVEPLLGPVDLGRSKGLPVFQWADKPIVIRDGATQEAIGTVQHLAGSWTRHDGNMQPWLDLVIAGGETGPGAWPAHPDWFRSVRDQCAAAGVGFHFKQWGEWSALSDHDRYQSCLVCQCGASSEGDRREWLEDHRRSCRLDATYMRRVGHKDAGRLLDGVEHNAGPHTEVSDVNAR